MAERQSIFSRPLDLIYVIYFATHIPVTLGIDFQVFYPPHWVPKVLSEALEFYVDTFKDPFMGSPTPTYWFLTFICCELVVQLPFFFIACVALAKGTFDHGCTAGTNKYSNRFQVHSSASCK